APGPPFARAQARPPRRRLKPSTPRAGEGVETWFERLKRLECYLARAVGLKTVRWTRVRQRFPGNGTRAGVSPAASARRRAAATKRRSSHSSPADTSRESTRATDLRIGTAWHRSARRRARA